MRTKGVGRERERGGKKGRGKEKVANSVGGVTAPATTTDDYDNGGDLSNETDQRQRRETATSMSISPPTSKMRRRLLGLYDEESRVSAMIQATGASDTASRTTTWGWGRGVASAGEGVE